MESGSASVYIMFMTVVFYTTGSICALRLAARLATHSLLPILSRILSYCYSLAATAAVSCAARYLPTLSKEDSHSRDSSVVGHAAVGLFFKFVNAARGQDDLSVSVSSAGPPHSATIAESTTASGRTTGLLRGATTLRLVLFSAFVGACGIAAAYSYFTTMTDRASGGRGSNIPGTTTPSSCACSAPSPTEVVNPSTPNSESQFSDLTGPARALAVDDGLGTAVIKTTMPEPKLNPTAPIFTPSSAHGLALIGPALTTPRRDDVGSGGGGGSGQGNDSAPASPADSTGPLTPSPVRSVFAFAARVAHTKSSEGRSGGGGELPFPIGVGRMRVVRPEEVVIGERQEGEVFVFF